jgi:hypothetical protein
MDQKVDQEVIVNQEVVVVDQVVDQINVNH